VTSIEFDWSDIPGAITPPRQIMQTLGEPTNVWVDFQLTEYARQAILRAYFYFAEKDISITVISRIPVLILQPENPGIRKAHWCLNGGGGYEELSFYAVIYPPLNSTLPVLNQARAFDLQSTKNAIDKGQLARLEDVFHVTPKEMYQRAMQEENACLEFEF